VAWPATGSAAPKAADLPARDRRKEASSPSLPPTPSPGLAAAEPERASDAGQDRAPGAGLDARYEQLRHAALHARAEAFPLGLGVLTSKGVTAWRSAITRLAPAASPARPAAGPAALAGGALPGSRPALPAALTAELISVLAGLVLAGTVP
jgi:hypothetical protein